MSFPKLHPHILEVLSQQGITEPLPFQEKSLSKIKSGASLFLLGPENVGKTTSLIISVMQRLKCQAELDSPRALIFVKDSEAGKELAEAFAPFIRRTDLRLFTALDEHREQHQKDDIYLGCDILIGSPRKLSKLFFLNGIHLGLLKMMIVEDALFAQKGDLMVEIIRISESVRNCQFLIYGEKMVPKLEKLRETFMEKAQLIKA